MSRSSYRLGRRHPQQGPAVQFKNLASKDRQEASANQRAHTAPSGRAHGRPGPITFLAACSSSAPSPTTTYTTFLPNLCIMRSKQLSFPAEETRRKKGSGEHKRSGNVIYLTGRMLLILAIANHDICNVSAKAGHNTLKTALFAWRHRIAFTALPCRLAHNSI